MAHEGDAKARSQRIESLDNELGRFSMIKGESVQSLYDDYSKQDQGSWKQRLE